MKVVVDCLGNDLGAKASVEGALSALVKDQDLEIILCGNEDEINKILDGKDYDKSRLEICHASEIVTNDDVPTVAIKTKVDSSLVKAFDLLKNREDVGSLVSCGSTGGVLTASFLKIGRIKGVSRPALCPILPTENGSKVLLLDCGANVDCKPINVAHFALMGSSYAKIYCGVENPRVALLNIGTEDKKGNEFSHECFEMLKSMPINFVGNMEARDFLSGKYDVVVSDGFDGNILLKSVEGTAKIITSMLKDEIKSSKRAKFGYLFMKGAFKKFKEKMNYKNYGGAVFLGVKKPVVKGHGSSDGVAFEKCILQAKTLAEKNLCENISNELQKIEIFEEGANG